VSRDNSFLYSGITSVTSEPMTARELQKFEKEHVKQKLKPATAIVLDAIQKERDMIVDLRSLVIDRTSTEQEVNTDLLARKLYLGYLNGLEMKIKQIVKEPKK
jgi:hypothetical protein